MDTKQPEQCRCSFGARMNGDGCRHCQPQTYIDLLERQAKEHAEEAAELEAQHLQELRAYRTTVDNLEAQLAAIGAGGVSKLMGASQAQPVGAAPQWVPVGERLPETGTPVLLDIGKKTPIRAMWAAKHTIEAGDDDTDWAEYVEADDMYYSPEGWYEWNQHEDTHWSVTDAPVAWMYLPAPYSAEAAPPPAAQALDAKRLSFLYSSDRTDSSAVLEMEIDWLNGRYPTLEQVRDAIDAAIAAKQGGQ